MKNLKKLAVVVVGSILLAGCSAANITVDTEPITYVLDGLDIKDVTSEHSDISGVDSVKLYEADGASVEIWEFTSDEDSKAWCDATREVLESTSTSNSGIEINDIVDYKYKVDGVNYRILCNGSTCVYAYGENDAIEAALKLMEIDD